MAEQLPPRKKFGTLRPNNFRDTTPEQELKSNDPWLNKAKEAFEASTTFVDTNLRKDWEDSTRHFQSKHMGGSKYYSDSYKYRSKMFRPKTRATVRQVEAATAAAFFSQLEVISYEPEDDHNPLHLAGSLLRQELINYRLSGKRQIPWFQICVGGMQEAQIFGVVVSKQFWDYQEKEVEMPVQIQGQSVLNEDGTPAVIEQKVKFKDQPDIKLYPIENVRFDPAAEWTDVVNSSPYFIAMESMRIGEIRKKIKDGEWEQVEESLLLSARNANYDSTRQARSGEKEDEKDSRYSKALSDFDLVWVHENFMRVDGDEYQYYTLGDRAMLSRPKPLDKAYLHGQRPFVVGTCMLEPHKSIPDSPVHLAKGTQKEANEVANTRLDNVKLVLNKRWLVKRGKQVDLQSLVRNAPASVTLVNDVQTDVLPVEFNDVTSSSYAEQDRINVDLDELLGSFSAGSVATNRKLGETVGGLQMLRGTSNSMGQYLIRVFSETWVEKVLNQLDELEQYYESDLPLLTTFAKRLNLGKYGIQAINKDLLMAPARVTVNIANSAMDPTIRLELFTFAMHKYAEFRQIMPPDMDPEPIKAYIFGLLGFRDASRFSVDPEGNPQMAAMQQEIQALTQALESKMAEIREKGEANFAVVMAKIEADKQKTAAELQQREMQSMRETQASMAEQGREERLQKYIAELQANTQILIAKMSADSQSANTQSSEDTKRFAAGLQNDTKAMIAAMQSGDKDKDRQQTIIDSSVKTEFGQLAQSFEQIANGVVKSNETMKTIADGLAKNAEKLTEAIEAMSAPRETEIVERDEEGMPRKSRSRISKLN